MGFEGLNKQNAAKRLCAVSKVVNQAVGDALSGLLLVEAILQHMGWSVDKWNELYSDLPSRQLKVSINTFCPVIDFYYYYWIWHLLVDWLNGEKKSVLGMYTS